MWCQSNPYISHFKGYFLYYNTLDFLHLFFCKINIFINFRIQFMTFCCIFHIETYQKLCSLSQSLINIFPGKLHRGGWGARQQSCYNFWHFLAYFISKVIRNCAAYLNFSLIYFLGNYIGESGALDNSRTICQLRCFSSWKAIEVIRRAALILKKKTYFDKFDCRGRWIKITFFFTPLLHCSKWINYSILIFQSLIIRDQVSEKYSLAIFEILDFI